MSRLKVHSHAQSDATVHQAWSVVRDFCGAWHPAIETIAFEQTGHGALIRRFKVKGDGGIYRERLTYFSDTERTMAYTHVEGIVGVQSYDARLSIAVSADNGSVVSMSAELSAPMLRAQEIADGTKAILDDGTRTIAKRAISATPADAALPTSREIKLERIELDDLPHLVLSASAGESDTICLFLHGIGGNRTNWTAQFAAVAPFCQAAAMDLRGYGESSLGSEQSSIDDYCGDILRVMDALGARRLVLCGLSFGAWIATSFAIRHPEKLAGLILSGGCTGMSEAGPDEREAFRLSREVPMNEGQTPADFAAAVVDAIAGPEAGIDNRATLRASMEAIPAATYADALRCFTNPLERFDFAKLIMPVLLMTGEHDRLAPPAEIKSVSERIWDKSPHPDVRFEVIAGAGHVCNLEKPQQYNAYLAEFLARLVP